ncbi:MAG: type II secretion system protein [Candidatus Dactylopiibacterium sp.]|nr:type II secretion system protein [Candidatus Dactylopiibacterium sp.]
MPARSGPARGFTLIELAIVLLILGVLGSGAFSALSLQIERSRLLEVHAQLHEAREALLNHAAATGALPCPDRSGDGEPDACNATGVTTGELPWHLLGLPARDPWGQPLRYTAHAAFTGAQPIALASLGGIEILALEAGGATQSLARPDAVVMALWSVGADGLSATAPPLAAHRVVARGPDVDDQAIWLSRFVLIGRMLETGHVLLE